MTQRTDWATPTALTRIVRAMTKRRGRLHLLPYTIEVQFPTITGAPLATTSITQNVEAHVAGDHDFLWVGNVGSRVSADVLLPVPDNLIVRARVGMTGRFLGTGARRDATAATRGWMHAIRAGMIGYAVTPPARELAS